MKITITDKILWDIYKFLEKTENIADVILTPRTPYKLSYKLFHENPIFKKYRQDIGKERFSKLIYYLKKKNYIKSENLKGVKAIMITEKGMHKTLKTSFKIEEKEKTVSG